MGSAATKPHPFCNLCGESDIDSDRTCRSIIASLIDMGIGNTPSKMKSSEVVFVGCKDSVFVKKIESVAVDPCCKDRKSTRLNSSHVAISYAVFCLKKKISE